MQILNAQYFRSSISGEINSLVATVDGQEVYIPILEDNRHYQAILDWVADGNTIQDAS